MIRDIKKSSLCVSFIGKFANMRKEGKFVVYPVAEGDEYIKIQDNRFGLIDKNGKLVITSKNETYANYASLISEMRNKTAKVDQLTEEEMNSLRSVLNVSGPTFGNSVVTISGNEGAKTF
jgi:hypothetical protein